MRLFYQALLMAGTVVVLACIGYPISTRLWGSEGGPALWWAAAGCFAAGLIGLVPPAIVARTADPSWLPQAAVGGMVLRVLLTGTFMLVVTEAELLPYGPFTACLIGFYLVLLVIETMIAASYAKQFNVPARGGSQP